MAKGLKTMCRFLTSWIQSRATSVVPVQDTLTITEGGMGHQKFVRGHMWPLGPHLAVADPEGFHRFPLKPPLLDNVYNIK